MKSAGERYDEAIERARQRTLPFPPIADWRISLMREECIAAIEGAVADARLELIKEGWHRPSADYAEAQDIVERAAALIHPFFGRTGPMG